MRGKEKRKDLYAERRDVPFGASAGKGKIETAERERPSRAGSVAKESGKVTIPRPCCL